MTTSDDLHPDYFYRKFHRGKLEELDGDISSHAQETADLDYRADQEFQKENFVDHFGQLLRGDTDTWRQIDTYNELMNFFWESKETHVQTYVIADGQGLSQSDQRHWFRSTLRFISLILPVNAEHPKGRRAPISSVSWADWFICVAASAAINSPSDILHIMSWSKDDKQFRYYARDTLQLPPQITVNETQPELEYKIQAEAGNRAWVYLCKAKDAFDEKGSAYLGPLNGHVNGGLAMKEIHKPWLHWLSGGRNMAEMLSPPLRAEIEAARWLTAPEYPALYGASVQSAENFESIVLDSLRDWTEKRQLNDFLDNGSARKSPLNIRRWAAHFLLTTNINIIATPTAEPIVPTDFFFNYEALRGYGNLLPNSKQTDEKWIAAHPDNDKALANLRDAFDKGELENTELRISDWTAAGWYSTYFIPQFRYDPQQYMAAARRLKLCIMQEVEPGTEDAVEFDPKAMTGGVYMGSLENGWIEVEGQKNIAFAVTQWGEGEFPWVTLQASVEDALGIWKAQQMFLGKEHDFAPCHLFSEKVFNAMMMVDFWNPIYSWKRLRLMQYIPATVTLDKTAKKDPISGENTYTYDLEENFLQNIKNAKDTWESQKESPEREFLDNLEKSLITHQIRIFRWASLVSGNLGTLQGNIDYLRLAESRRRLFRPLPMNFFGNNLPYCLAIPPDAPYLEMCEDGEVREIPMIGLKWLGQWLGSLAGSDPTIIPQQESIDARVHDQKPLRDRKMLPRGATSRMQCQASIVMTNPRSAKSCPFMQKAYKQRECKRYLYCLAELHTDFMLDLVS